jgi:hypothetical protein
MAAALEFVTELGVLSHGTQFTEEEPDNYSRDSENGFIMSGGVVETVGTEELVGQGSYDCYMMSGALVQGEDNRIGNQCRWPINWAF